MALRQISLFLYSRQTPNLLNRSAFRLSTSSTTITVSHTDDTQLIRLIGINRPLKRNCVNHSTALQLFEAFQVYENDPTSRLGILYGEGGKAFCAGYDLSEVSSGNITLSSYDKNENAPMGPSRMQLKKPLIAAISGIRLLSGSMNCPIYCLRCLLSGPCVAGGLELSLLADMRIGEKSSKYGVLCRRFGVPLIDGGTVRPINWPFSCARPHPNRSDS